MARINLTIDEELFGRLESAKKDSTPMNLYILHLLATMHPAPIPSSTFDDALSKLIAEAQDRRDGEFILSDLQSFADIGVATAENGHIQPSTMRATLGKAFNLMVREGNVPDVRVVEITGENGKTAPKRKYKAAVFAVNRPGNYES